MRSWFLDSGGGVSSLSAPASVSGQREAAFFTVARSAEVALSHLRETDVYLSRRTKLGKKDAAEVSEPRPLAKGKPKAGAGPNKEAEN